MKVEVEISSCKDCPFIEYGNWESTDGFDRGRDWVCGKTNAKIDGFVEWHEVDKIEIPDWCPLKKQSANE